MNNNNNKQNDKLKKRTAETRRVEHVLLEHFPEHPRKYPPAAYRYNAASIRVRVISRRFKGMDRVDRADLVYPILERHLPEKTWWDLSLVLLLTPDEVGESPGNA
jgi:stress-induced morphogen